VSTAAAILKLLAVSESARLIPSSLILDPTLQVEKVVALLPAPLPAARLASPPVASRCSWGNWIAPVWLAAEVLQRDLRPQSDLRVNEAAPALKLQSASESARPILFSLKPNPTARVEKATSM
jgi:hypothetical protein